MKWICSNKDCSFVLPYVMHNADHTCPVCHSKLIVESFKSDSKKGSIVSDLEECRKQINLLKSKTRKKDIHEQLQLDRKIRNNINTDSVIIQFNDGDNKEDDDEITMNLEELLKELLVFQNTIVSKVLSEIKYEYVSSRAEVKDYQKAKRAFSDIIKNEIQFVDKKIELFPDISALKNHRYSLAKMAESCTTGKYRVCVLGEFQIGKTTLINAVSGGRYIGSIGAGIATSAVPISVTYGDEDSFVINKKSWSQLKAIVGHLSPYLDQFVVDDLDIDDIDKRQAFLDELDAFRSSSNCPSLVSSELKYLFLSAIILKYYGAEDMEHFLNDITISEISRITKFPEKYASRWKDEGINGFSLEECAFIFIDEIECLCCSEPLKQLNCIITDCPGLFNSEYDTAITSQIMAESEAILYLLPYTKETGDKGWASLEKIKNDYPDCHRKLYIVNNLTLYADNDAFYENNLLRVKSLFGDGFQLPKIDALLAYLGSIKDTYESGKLSPEFIDQFVAGTKKPSIRSFGSNSDSKNNKTSFTNFNDAWNYRIKDYSTRLVLDHCYTPDSIIEMSGLYAFISGLKSFIENNRAYTILISNGINKMTTNYLAIKDQMETRHIEPYLQGRKKIMDIWEQRLNDSNEFNARSKLLVHSYFFDKRPGQETMVRCISNAVSDMLFTEEVFNSIAESISETVFENKQKLIKMSKDKDALQKFLSPLIASNITEIVEERLNYWNTLMESGNESTFSNIFKQEMENLGELLEKEWGEIYKDDSFKTKMHNYVKIPKDASDFILQSNSQSTKIDIDKKALIKSMIAKVAVISTGIAMTIASYVVFLIGSAAASAVVSVSNPITLLIAIILLLGGGITILTAGPEAIKKHFVEKIRPKIKKNIEDNDLKTKLGNMIFDSLSKQFETLEKKIKINQNLMKNDMSIATTASDDDIEKSGVNAVIAIHEYNEMYETIIKFRKENINEET